MAKIRYCPLCERNVVAKKKFSWSIFLLLTLTIGGWLIYLIWYIFKSRRICPICGAKLEAIDTKSKILKADKDNKNNITLNETK